MDTGISDMGMMRIKRMKKRVEEQNDAGLYRSNTNRIVAESLRRTVDEPVQIRRAKAIAHLLDNVNLNIFPDEPIVGSMIGLWELETGLPGYEEQKETAISAIEEYLENKKSQGNAKKVIEIKHKTLEEEVAERESRWALMSRVHHDASLTYSDYQLMLADMESHFADTGIQRYEIGKVLEAELRIEYDPDDRRIMNELPWIPGNHLGLDYEVAIVKGLKAMKEEIRSYRDNTDDPEKQEFYMAADIVISSVTGFFGRYAELARKESLGEKVTEERRSELIIIAEILEKMSSGPADSFHEALQAVWLLHVMSNIIGGSAMSFSRFDQYMLRFYEDDLKKGVPREEIKELLCCFWLKINEPKLRTVQSMTVGGVKPDGSEAASDLTKLCLETAAYMKLPYPNIAVRVGKNTPEWVYEEIIQTIKAGCGQPMILNDEVFVSNFKKLGYPDELARDYFNMGCVELMIQGRQPLWGSGESVIYTDCLQQTFDSFKRGEMRFDTFDEFMDYFLTRIREKVEIDHQLSLVKKESLKVCYDPFCSLFTKECIKRGKDMHHGGSECPTHWSIYAHGLGTAADSLAAVKKFVYDEKKVTLEYLAGALDANFDGYEDLQLMLDKDTPYFGNDIDGTDEIADRVFGELTRSIFELNNLGEDDKYVSTFFSYFSHVLTGEVTKATPNGRLAGQSLSDSMAPTQGKDINGPTKMLNSILKIDHSYVTGGYALNLKVNHMLMKDSQGEKAIISLIKAYLAGDGPQIQINYVDIESLKEAQIYPEKHRDLVVRIGGYCEYFVNLDQSLQNEIIQRTIHGTS